MKDYTIKAAILRVLSENGPQSVSQLHCLFPHAGGKKALQSRMFIIVKSREAKKVGRHACPTCGSNALRFDITDKGKQYLKLMS